MNDGVIMACFAVPMQSATDKLVLIRLAREADGNGGGIAVRTEVVARDCGVSPRNAQYIIKKLRDLGILIAASDNRGGRGKAAEFCIDLRKCRELASGETTQTTQTTQSELRGLEDENHANHETQIAGFPPPYREVNNITPLERTSQEDDDNARKRLRLVAVEVFRLMGTSLDDPKFFGGYGRVGSWLAEGADPELDIYPTVRRLMDKRGAQGPPRFLTYFDEEIEKSRKIRSRPMPEVPDHEPHRPRRTAQQASGNAWARRTQRHVEGGP